jgi:hypothetical protein
MPRFSLARPSKIYPNWDFWFENKPSGNPESDWLKLCLLFQPGFFFFLNDFLKWTGQQNFLCFIRDDYFRKNLYYWGNVV